MALSAALELFRNRGGERRERGKGRKTKCKADAIILPYHLPLIIYQAFRYEIIAAFLRNKEMIRESIICKFHNI